MYQKRKNLENILIILIDIMCILFSGGVAYWLRYHVFYGRYASRDGMWQILLLCGIYLLTSIFMDTNRQFFRRGFFKELLSIIKSEIVLALAWILGVFLIHRTEELSRLVFAYFFLTNTLCMYIMHQLFKLYMTKLFKYGRYSNRLLLVTTSDAVEKNVKNLVSHGEWNRQLVGVVLLDQQKSSDEGSIGYHEIAVTLENQKVQSVTKKTFPQNRQQEKNDNKGSDTSQEVRTLFSKTNSYPVVAGSEDWIDYVVHNEIDEVFLLYPDSAHSEKIQHWIQELGHMGVTIDVNIDEFNLFPQGEKSLNRVGKYAVVTNVRNAVPIWGTVLKRMLDIIGGVVGMVILGIATVIVAPAIKIESKGPIFFGQTRIGKNGRRFTFYKFRSMYADAEERKQELMEQNEMQGLMFKMEEDPRITKVGKFLRRTSIDELPQFWNVLKGDMSLVGTRPPTEDEFIQYEAKHKCRLSMTPGLTGLWQVSGRSDITDFDEVVELDMEYIDNWSIGKDIKILLLTVKAVFLGKGSK